MRRRETKYMKTTIVKQYTKSPIDLELIKKIAGNANLTTEEIFQFPTFIIARSGLNRNHSDITPEGQRTAAKQWIGKAILFRDHESSSSNQIGRIYDSWVEEVNGETITYGKGYGILTSDHKDIYKRIENRIHSEMSCAYEIVKSVCSECGADLIGSQKNECPQGHVIGQNAHARDLEFIPDHISFVGRPGVEGAGLVASEDQQRMLKVFSSIGNNPEEIETNLKALKRDAEDGREFRVWAADEFVKWYTMSNPEANSDAVNTLAEKLTVREMLALGRIEKERFHEVMPSGKQFCETSPPETETVSNDGEPISLKEISNAMKG